MCRVMDFLSYAINNNMVTVTYTYAQQTQFVSLLIFKYSNMFAREFHYNSQWVQRFSYRLHFTYWCWIRGENLTILPIFYYLLNICRGGGNIGPVSNIAPRVVYLVHQIPSESLYTDICQAVKCCCCFLFS